MLDKIKFWKKEKENIEQDNMMNEPTTPDNTEPSPGIPEFGSGIQQEPIEQPKETEQSGHDLINSKLDAIKSELDNVNLRIKNIEKIAEAEEKKQKIWK
jgi:hypothetical protein